MPSMVQIAGVPLSVLPQDVRLIVVVVVAGPLDVPARPRIERADGAVGQHGRSRSSARSRVCRCSFCHRMSDLLSPLKSPVPLMCQVGPGLNEPAALLASTVGAVHQPDRGRAVCSPATGCRTCRQALKSPVALICQVGPGLNKQAGLL